MTDLAGLSFEEDSGQPVARIQGEIDASNADELREQLYDGVSNQALGLVIDLTKVTYIDSAGVRLLFDLAERLRRRGQALHLARADDSSVAEVVHLVALREVAAVHRSASEAIDALTRD